MVWSEVERPLPEAMAALEDAPERVRPVSSREVVQATDLDATTAVRALERLEAAGYVELSLGRRRELAKGLRAMTKRGDEWRLTRVPPSYATDDEVAAIWALRHCWSERVTAPR